jgi:4-diphosphocytidyl-2-C-methyl-D-erythritol kinase
MNVEKKSYTRLTLALDIVRKIPSGPAEGYHELGTIKHRIDLHDSVTVADAPRDVLECNDPMVPCDDRNVCMKVLHLLRRTCSIDRTVRISIAKNIPVMGGLAGGSANAATTFEALCELWDLRLSRSRLVQLGRTIGMDIPYFFIGGTAFDSEAGERLEPIATALSFTFVLALPEFGVSTQEAYEALDYNAIGKQTTLTAALQKALAVNNAAAVPPLMHNDFERPVFSRYARLADIKQKLVQAGCLAAVLTGSGSTIIGLARDRDHAGEIAGKVDCRTIIASTLRDGSTTTATA